MVRESIEPVAAADNETTSAMVTGTAPDQSISAVVNIAGTDIDLSGAYHQVVQLQNRANMLREGQRPAQFSTDRTREITTDKARRFIDAVGTLIHVVETRYHMDSPRFPRLPFSRSRKAYNDIEAHCRKARALKDSMEANDIGDFERLRRELFWDSIWNEVLAPYQLQKISLKTTRLLDHIKSALRLFEEYRNASIMNAEYRRKTLAEDLKNITTQVNQAVAIMDATTRLAGAVLQPVQIPIAAASTAATGN
jgi:hypothetical protein